ncbi:hypothetical protein NKH18_24785 [Streptomyces sp. M10(2022)]
MWRTHWSSCPVHVPARPWSWRSWTSPPHRPCSTRCRSDTTPEPGSVLMLRKSGTWEKRGNPLTRKFNAWIFGGGAGFGSAVVSAVRAEALRGRCGAGRRSRSPSMYCWASWRWSGR